MMKDLNINTEFIKLKLNYFNILNCLNYKYFQDVLDFIQLVGYCFFKTCFFKYFNRYIVFYTT